MRRSMRWIAAVSFAAMLPTGVFAQGAADRRLPPVPPPPPPPPPPPYVQVSPIDIEAFRAATPYNPIFVGRPLPNPIYNYPNFVLCCDIPNMGLEPYIYPHWTDGWGWGDARSWTDNCDNYNPCGAIFNHSSGGCGCNGGHAQAPARLNEENAIQTVGWFRREKDPVPIPSPEACPNCAKKVPPSHHLPTPASLGCTSCSSWESEYVFIFGSCRQFFGEPTHDWLHHGR